MQIFSVTPPLNCVKDEFEITFGVSDISPQDLQHNTIESFIIDENTKKISEKIKR